MPSIAGFLERIQVMLGQVDQRKHSCRGPASGRDGCCRFNLRKSEEAMGIKFCGFKESLLGIVNAVCRPSCPEPGLQMC
jgi:hypothetical protein